MQRHVGVMTALGSKEASLVNKFKNYLHSAFLECGTWDAVRIQCDTVMSFTTDLGTEASLGSMPPVSLTELFPHLVFDIEGQLEFEFDPARVLQQAPQPAANGQERFFKQAVVSPGILHIIHTATQDVLTSILLNVTQLYFSETLMHGNGSCFTCCFMPWLNICLYHENY